MPAAARRPLSDLSIAQNWFAQAESGRDSSHNLLNGCELGGFSQGYARRISVSSGYPSSLRAVSAFCPQTRALRHRSIDKNQLVRQQQDLGVFFPGLERFGLFLGRSAEVRFRIPFLALL